MIKPMWKEKRIRFARNFAASVRMALRLHPVELMLVLYGCVSCMLWYGCGWEDERAAHLILVPPFVLFALAVNLFAGNGPWRKLYLVCWIPIVPLSFLTSLGDWVGTTSCLLTLGVLAPLALLMARRATDNFRFVSDAMVYLRSAMLALFFANVILGLFGAILFSTAYIFGVESRWTDHLWIYALIVSETLLVPVFLLVMVDRWLDCGRADLRLLDLLLNRIVTPALLIYLAMLWLYILKIVVTWTLPDGGVAYLVFGFTIFALLVKALQELLDRRIYNWFFDRFSLFALPPIVLFWVGAMRRVNEYGLTEPRVWLLVCGGLMTLSLVLFLSRRTGRYLCVALAAFVCFGAIAYVPVFDPARIAVRSQGNRVALIAGSLGRLAPDGTLLRTPVAEADTVRRADYRRLYEALEYIEDRDEERFAAFGLHEPDDLLGELPDERFRSYVKWGRRWGDAGAERTEWWRIEAPVDRRADIRGYSTLYTNLNRYSEPEQGYSFSNDTLCVRLGQPRPLLVLSGRELLDAQLQRAGCTPQELNIGTDSLRKTRFLDYENDTLRILFENILLETSDNETRIDDVSVEMILMR